jgi:hypothetical protein
MCVTVVTAGVSERLMGNGGMGDDAGDAISVEAGFGRAPQSRSGPEGEVPP